MNTVDDVISGGKDGPNGNILKHPIARTLSSPSTSTVWDNRMAGTLQLVQADLNQRQYWCNSPSSKIWTVLHTCWFRQCWQEQCTLKNVERISKVWHYTPDFLMIPSAFFWWGITVDILWRPQECCDNCHMKRHPGEYNVTVVAPQIDIGSYFQESRQRCKNIC